jgi:putative NADH-flavin reductase
MNIIIFGSNGGIGSQTVEQALAAGHNVTAIARRPESVKIQHECLKVIRGDVMDINSIIAPMRGQEVVVSSLGTARSEATTLYSEGVSNIMTAMGQAGVRRLLCISASGLEPGPLWQKVAAKLFLWTFLKEMYLDLVRMETAVKASTLDWTIIRPPRLTNKPRTGHYDTAVNQHVSGSVISRADVADYIVNHLTDKQTYRGMVELAY